MAKIPPRSAAELRLMNRNRVYRYLYSTAEPITKPELAYALSMSLPTLTQNLNELLEQGLIENSRFANSTGGRKARILSVVPQARFAVGVEVSSGHIRLVAVDLMVNELASQTIKRAFSPDERYAIELSDSIEQFLADHNLETERLLGIGITVPGIVDNEQQVILDAPTLNIRRMDSSRLTGHIHRPFHLVNDANAGGFAEWWNRTGTKDMAYLSLGRGTGGAILIAGVAYLGNHIRSGEFGHMCIHPDGRSCSCGRRGCLEAYCSTARLSDDLGISLEQFFSVLAQGNEEYTRIWNDYLRNLVIGIRNINTMLDCGVVLGGTLSPFLTDHISAIESLLCRIEPNYRADPYLSICRYHAHASGIGAALHFVEQFIVDI